MRATDNYVDQEAKPVVSLAELQHAVDDEARVEVRVDLGTRVQLADIQVLANNGATVDSTVALLRSAGGDDPVMRETLTEVGMYRGALAKEIGLCEAGLYTDCLSQSSTLVQPERIRLLQQMGTAFHISREIENCKPYVSAGLG